MKEANLFLKPILQIVLKAESKNLVLDYIAQMKSISQWNSQNYQAIISKYNACGIY